MHSGIPNKLNVYNGTSAGRYLHWLSIDDSNLQVLDGLDGKIVDLNQTPNTAACLLELLELQRR
jgi:hypothetical protein